jgi:hypothetical protein
MSDAAVYAFAKALLAGSTSEAELQFVLAVSRGETAYTTAWPVGAGAGSNNWASITQPNLAQPHFDHPDTHADGSKFLSHFKVYPSMQNGLLDAASIILKPNVRAALANGDGDAAVQAMHDNKFFELPVPKYQAAVRRNHAALVRGAGLIPAVKFGGSDVGLLLLLALAVGFFL